MVSIRPVNRLLVPTSSVAAQSVMGPNYDEFQGDREVWDVLQACPQSVLKLTMAHCDVATPDAIGVEGEPEALQRAAGNLQALIDGPLTRTVSNVLWVYEIVDRRRPQTAQVGLGGNAVTAEIRTETNPQGSVIRNEGIREPKARGRADLIQHTRCCVGIVNLAVEDPAGTLQQALDTVIHSRECDYQAVDEVENRHRVWLISDPGEIQRFQHLMSQMPEAYVADGNHRSAAAALLGRADYLAVFFPTSRMWLAPYNRLVRSADLNIDRVLQAVAEGFHVEPLAGGGPFQPAATHVIGLYHKSGWFQLVPHSDSFDATNAARAIDADIVQRLVFDRILGITDPRDQRLTFVGGNRDAAYLQSRVDSGEFDLAVTLPAVTMEQFMDVCRQNRFMPPKSTWFEPKIRSGLVISLFDDSATNVVC